MSTTTNEIKNPLHPIFEPAKFVREDGEIMTPLYFDGAPRDYRLDMGFGTLCEGNARDKVKGIGNQFKVIPIAVRALKGKVFVKKAELEMTEEKKWVEVYFVNNLGNLCMFMFHGFSVQNLSAATKVSKYNGVKLTESVWTIRCHEKTNKENQKYYMAFFHIEPLNDDDKNTMKHVYSNLIEKTPNIYREDTIKYETLFYENWNDGSIVTEATLEAEKQKQKALLKDFATKEELELENINKNKKQKTGKAPAKKKTAKAA